jgi:hypothetical protein
VRLRLNGQILLENSIGRIEFSESEIDVLRIEGTVEENQNPVVNLMCESKRELSSWNFDSSSRLGWSTNVKTSMIESTSLQCGTSRQLLVVVPSLQSTFRMVKVIRSKCVQQLIPTSSPRPTRSPLSFRPTKSPITQKPSTAPEYWPPTFPPVFSPSSSTERPTYSPLYFNPTASPTKSPSRTTLSPSSSPTDSPRVTVRPYTASPVTMQDFVESQNSVTESRVRLRYA